MGVKMKIFDKKPVAQIVHKEQKNIDVEKNNTYDEILQLYKDHDELTVIPDNCPNLCNII